MKATLTGVAERGTEQARLAEPRSRLHHNELPSPASSSVESHRDLRELAAAFHQGPVDRWANTCHECAHSPPFSCIDQADEGSGCNLRVVPDAITAAASDDLPEQAKCAGKARKGGVAAGDARVRRWGMFAERKTCVCAALRAVGWRSRGTSPGVACDCARALLRCLTAATAVTSLLITVAAPPAHAQQGMEPQPGQPAIGLPLDRGERQDPALPPTPESLAPKSIPQAGPQPTFDEELVRLARVIPTFGGLFVDEEADTLFVYLTRSSASTLRTVARRLRALFEIPERRTRMLPARYGWGQLKTWHDRLTRALSSVSGVAMTDIDDRRNRLTVGVTDLRVSGEVQRRLNRLRIPRAAVRVVRRAPAAEVSSLRDSHRPLVNGLQVNMSGGGLCTLGFVAWNPRHSQWGLVTNTHCTDTRGSLEGTRFFQHSRSGTLFQNRPGTDSNEIARETDDPSYFTGGNCPTNRRCRYSDSAFAAFTSFPNPQPTFRRGFIAFAGTDASWQGATLEIGNEESSPIVGRSVGKIGRTSGISIGKVTSACLTANSYRLAGDGTLQDTGTTLICQGQATYKSESGDSGAPVYSSSGGVWHLAGLNYRGDAMFSPISQIQRSDELGWLYFCTSRC